MVFGRYLLAFLLGSVLVAGCGSGEKTETAAAPPNSTSTPPPVAKETNKVVGRWTVAEVPDLDVEIKADGTMTADLPMPNKRSVKVFTTSSYRLEGNKLYTTPTGMRVEGATPEEEKAMTDSGKSLQGQEVGGTITWVSDDEFTVTPDVANAPKMTYKRKS